MKTYLYLALTLPIYLAGCNNEKIDASAELQPTEPQQKVIEPVAVERPAPEVSLDQNEAFEAFKNHFLESLWALNPSYGVYVGYYKHADQLLVPDGELRGRRRAFFVRELQALKSFNANRLNAANATDLAIIEGKIKSSLWYFDVFRSYEWNPAQYNPAGSFGVILTTEYAPLEERLAAISNRLQNVPAYYDAAKANLKTPTLPHLGLAIQQTKGALGMFKSQIPAKVTIAKDAGTIDEVGASALDARLADAVTAVQGYLEWLEAKEAELKASGEARSFRIGAELYEKKFKHDIASGYTAAELYQLALDAKQNLHTQMIEITEQLWPNYFAEQAIPEDRLVAVKQLIDQLSLKHVARENFVDEVRRQIPVLQAFVDEHQLLDSDPTRPLVVRLTPEYQRGFAGASVNAPGPYDATANTYYNVSPLDDYTEAQAESYLREYNHWILQILNIHEAIPGHYTQLMHANKSPSKIKSIFGNGAMVEGWAVYSERMMLEAGYANDEPEMWLMYSKWNLRVVVNTILDYSIQVLGMEQEEALDLLMNEAFQERTEAEGKWRRATVSQVQLTSYFAGYSEIMAFREQLKERLGDRFDLREFHNKFLSYGNAPVPVIKNLMLADIEAAEVVRARTPRVETTESLPIENSAATELDNPADVPGEDQTQGQN
ncbi:hypothetical protein GCM10008090_16690 [Arenicella chitinivorans]|uniref:DUF885 domain-containing protein n=1 Tax=Arenicella chitinivorans TaxID=1329800 RepID=A0A918VJY4_9GAMM|nr:DUF885 domain-containing protein [Arenicella chitinivorans]GHA07521.1 hypothetical protein GCM10008090_16690 [Arenicella chitinivorans]